MPVSPLNIQVKMVTEDGTPTPEFMRWWQEFLATVNPLSYADGVSDLLDVIGSTWGSILIRGEDGWALLAPGTSGTALITQGAAADPIWGLQATTFVDLTDTPGDYASFALQAVRVNAGETALEFYTPSTVGDFVDLGDVPSSYVGQALLAVRVNAGETALEFYTPSAGVTTWLALSDTPANFTGDALKAVRVNAGETALEFYTPAAGASTWLALTDTASSFSGEAGQIVAVNTGETALEFIDPPTGGGGGAGIGNASLAWADVAITNGDFETGDGTGWTTDIGAIRIEDWAALSAAYATAGMTVGNNGTYIYDGGNTAGGGAQAEVSSYQDIDITAHTDVIAYRLSAESYKNWADTDFSYIQLDLLDVNGDTLATDYIIGTQATVSFEPLEVSVHSHPDGTDLRVRIGVDRGSGTNNNAGIDNVVLSKLGFTGPDQGSAGIPAEFGTYSLSTGDTISKATENQIQFDTEDKAAAFGTLATATGVVTISEKGTYTVNWAIHLTNGSAGDTTMQVGVKVNGTKVLPETTHYHTFSWAQTINGSITVEVVTGDTIELYMNYTGGAGASDTVTTAGKWTWMQIVQDISGGTTAAAFRGFRATVSGTQIVSGATTTDMNFATEEFDTEDGFASHVFTVPASLDGMYMDFHASVAISSVGNTWLYIKKDVGAGYVNFARSNVYNSYGAHVDSGPIQVNTGDKFKVQLFFSVGETVANSVHNVFDGRVLATGGSAGQKTFTELLTQDLSSTSLTTTPVEILGLDDYDQVLIYLTEASGGASILAELSNDGGTSWITSATYNRFFTATTFDGRQDRSNFWMTETAATAALMVLEGHSTAAIETTLKGHQGTNTVAVVESQWMATLEVHDGIRLYMSSGTKTVGILRVVGVKG